jgi:hypothetical protein
MSRGKAAPFKGRVETALAAAKAAGVGKVKIKTADGSSYEFELQPGEPPEVNPFDLPPDPVPLRRRGNRRENP